MPCNTLTTQSVNLAKAMPEIVWEAMRTLGWNRFDRHHENYLQARAGSNTVTWTPGKGITVQGYDNAQPLITALTKEYSKQAVTWAAKRVGWTVRSVGQDKLTVSRR